MWYQYPAKRVVNITGYLGEIESRLPPNHPYKDNDKVTWAHEGTHGVNSEMRNAEKNMATVYLLDNIAFKMNNITYYKLSDVAKEVPQELRGNIYKLYMVDQQRWWNDMPLYVIDELAAYLNGTRVGEQLQVEKSRVEYSLKCALEMYGYSGTLLRMLRTLDDIRNLTSLLQTIKVRLMRLVKSYPNVQPVFDQYNKYVNLTRTPIY
jgi:hypothetical protein